ncbi:hypothetical protein [Cyanobium sp. CH-040]|uniref:hypothetical protein n=1 Tax=Cyanobium sp. CH-040 TaxID=2823708 RepID=UPI0020CD1790|nr:hypothetical protein [Cyanobium sp. CH-040]MCP9928894.1 hypothetical protein [Cyanobium sp. CH-040]
MVSLSAEQREDLQAFLRDWLRHTGRTQADLRRALKAGSIRMPVLLDALQGIHARGGLAGLAEQLCAIEETWQREDAAAPADQPSRSTPLDASLGQLDLLLQEIRGES